MVWVFLVVWVVYAVQPGLNFCVIRRSQCSGQGVPSAQCTEVHSSSFFSGRFITAHSNYPLERKLAKCISVHCSGPGDLKDPGIPKLLQVRNIKQKAYIRKSIHAAYKLGQQTGHEYELFQIHRNKHFFHTHLCFTQELACALIYSRLLRWIKHGLEIKLKTFPGWL